MLQGSNGRLYAHRVRSPSCTCVCVCVCCFFLTVLLRQFVLVARLGQTLPKGIDEDPPVLSVYLLYFIRYITLLLPQVLEYLTRNTSFLKSLLYFAYTDDLPKLTVGYDIDYDDAVELFKVHLLCLCFA
jgi:hypothetical protein